MNQAPEFCLPNQDGAEISLRDLKGKWVVLYFYPKDDTPGCTTEACDFTTSIQDFEDLDAIVIGVSPDSVAKHKKFVDKHSLKVTLLSDEQKTTLNDYGVWQEKSMCGKKYMGVVRTTVIINPEGLIVKQFNNVKVKGHIDAVKKALQELKA